MNVGMFGQIAFQRQRHGAFLQLIFWLVDACQRNQMLSVPVAAVHFHEGGIGQKINGAFKQVDGIAARCRDTEREPLVAPAGIANEISANSSEVGVSGLVVLVHPDEYCIVVGCAFIQPPRLDAEINEVRINATAAKIAMDTAGIGIGRGQQQHLGFLRLGLGLSGLVCHQPSDPLHGFHEGDFFHLYEIIQRIVAAEATGEPVPFPVGDFQGIIRKLDYIKELGCNAIWLNPCFVSPFSDAGYDVADYYTAAPRYGTNEDLKELFAKAHEKDMHVILDLVPGHTSIEHPWFKASLSPEENEFSHRYIWTDKAWKGFENVGNIKGCIRGLSDRDGSCAANYYTTQPALNYGFYKVTESWQKDMHSPEAMATREAMKDIMRFWLGMGCDGFRVDMAGSLVKNDEEGKGTIELWQDFRKFLDEEFPEAAMISEWGQPDKSLEGGYHMDFLLHFGPSYYMDLFRSEHPYFKREGKGNIGDFVRTYQANYDKTNGKGLICIPSGDHDMSRIKEKLDDEEVKIPFCRRRI